MCKQRATHKYNAKVKPKTFQKGDLVWRIIGNARKDATDGKLAQNWEGPFLVQEALNNDTFRLEYLDDKQISRIWNANHLKFYFS